MNHIKLDREKKIPHVKTKLRSHHIVTMPDEIYAASGIVIMGRRIKSLIFSTDIAIIRNCNADAVLAVYPFTPQQSSRLLQMRLFPPPACPFSAA